jgi:hypothetical protein
LIQQEQECVRGARNCLCAMIDNTGLSTCAAIGLL